ncbi:MULTISPECIES: signal recognition particle-docking protein FtsY [unclassified Agrobacterium]|uniref:signal recognition particle-docking protein FtsY n=1 Tax=unclassified Agrobacterium TaxID=2632611 RepID=UPI002447E2E6|nr:MULTISPECIES: signal recognition particle-docking protein FtsY [unclassified Agrobacterium]MDH0614695.1 signal recognition particle-docking protein FtsY [Agrobacterium sp. GD03872]MDH0697062.1 signal recognition particle-docking protein FtsY [Agrobacterium sp. GD03871]MDH1059542.1 signal recognition particle-docking protein FtsY [Agrobacterium sp. GD03992]MDH2212249.1 signal recognition particle-docking protein FtsY [Agrobacterium sp. GD03643]MDH2219975.1 signal recognition particle-docking
MALGFIKKVFSFGKDKAETEERPQEDAAPERGNENASFEAALSDAEAHGPVDKDPVSELEMETAGGPAPDEVPSDDDEEEDAPLLPGAELSGDMGVVPLSLLQAEAAAEEQDEALPEAVDVVLDADAMDALLDEAEAATAAEPSAISPALPKGFSSASERQEPAPAVPQVKLTWFQRLRAGLARTSSQLTTQISALFTKRKLDEDTLDELEDLLIQSDLGVETAMRITGALSSERYGKDVSGEDVARIMAGEITKVLKPVAKPLELDLSHKPHVILVVGVNGTGKTTTIGKLAAKLSGSGLKVMLAAGDTFRAAAIEQLKIWADRTGSQFIGTKLGADASGLAYDAYEQARAQKSDVLIIDTAGRLQNKTELMAELEKIVRVLGKLDPDAPHTVLQTLDATTGQNAMNQVEIFRNVAGVSGLIMTKLDGTARGGILVAIAAQHKLPVYFIGVGEGVDDLEPFEAEDFAKAIAGV